jgi:glucosamine-phosphate N-acetyltransferase
MLFRRLEINDYNLGYLQLLEQLTNVGDIPYNEWTTRYKEIQNNPCIQIWVMVDTVECQNTFGTAEPELAATPFGVALHGTNTIIATGTIILEPKFIHNNGTVGHIEDIVVDKDKNGLGIGKKLIDELVNIAINNGCYKVILNCSETNIGFYEKAGFKTKDRQMALYF